MKSSRPFRFVLAVLSAFTLSLAVCAQAQTFKTIFSFNGINGRYPQTGLIFDSAGNLYGAAEDGGDPKTCTFYYGCGVVYRLSPTAGGTWQDTTLFAFTTSNTGALPDSSLLLTSNGGLIGTVYNGGSSDHCGGAVAGCGLVYELSPALSGFWPETVLQYFDDFTDGGISAGGIIADSAGNLYGTTVVGGNTSGCGGNGCGTVFRLAPNGSGSWEETVLYTFTGASDGGSPGAALILDAAGNLYGTTVGGGNTAPGCATSDGSGCGVVFELSPTESGSWSESVLYRFTGGHDGAIPESSLVFDSAGNLYGTTYLGGFSNSNCIASQCGVVYKLSPNGSGGWRQTVVHEFKGSTDGQNPVANVILDSAGNLYGTAPFGGNVNLCSPYGGCGVAFKISPAAGGWSETPLHIFADGNDGAFPYAPLTFDSSGNLYGATMSGSNEAGVVYKITP